MKKTLLALALVLTQSAFATTCPTLYPDSRELTVIDTAELCSSFYVSRYNPNHKAVILVSEHLKKGAKVGSAERVNAFKADDRVVRSATPSDYSNSGYDKGHMAPAGNASSASQMAETFLMTNMTPQEPTLNRNAWRVLEENIRDQFATEQTDFYIVTIALYNNPKRIGKDIPVPSGYWKFVFHGGKVDAYYAENKPHATIARTTGVDINKIITNAQRW